MILGDEIREHVMLSFIPFYLMSMAPGLVTLSGRFFIGTAIFGYT
jgi:hypothetical protein